MSISMNTISEEKGISVKIPLDSLDSLYSLVNMIGMSLDCSPESIPESILDRAEEVEVTIEKTIDGEYELNVDLAYSPSGTRSILSDVIDENKFQYIFQNIGEKYPWSLIF